MLYKVFLPKVLIIIRPSILYCYLFGGSTMVGSDKRNFENWYSQIACQSAMKYLIEKLFSSFSSPFSPKKVLFSSFSSPISENNYFSSFSSPCDHPVCDIVVVTTVSIFLWKITCYDFYLSYWSYNLNENHIKT